MATRATVTLIVSTAHGHARLARCELECGDEIVILTLDVLYS